MTGRALSLGGLLLAAVASLPCAAVAASADRWVAVGPTAGGLGLDSDLADYRWDTRPASQWGAQAMVGRGRLAGGLWAWSAGTTQGTGLPEADVTPRVALRSIAAVGLVRVASPLGCALWLGGQAGRLRMRWEPGELAIETGAGPVTVAYQDIDEWSLGVVAELRRSLGRGVVAGLQVERSGFALDTAHRNGGAVELGRDRFTNWSARLQLAWQWAL